MLFCNGAKFKPFTVYRASGFAHSFFIAWRSTNMLFRKFPLKSPAKDDICLSNNKFCTLRLLTRFTIKTKYQQQFDHASTKNLPSIHRLVISLDTTASVEGEKHKLRKFTRSRISPRHLLHAYIIKGTKNS